MEIEKIRNGTKYAILGLSSMNPPEVDKKQLIELIKKAKDILELDTPDGCLHNLIKLDTCQDCGMGRIEVWY